MNTEETNVNNSIYSDEQQRLMYEAMSLRMVGITSLKKKWEGSDPSIGEMRVANEMASSVESTVMSEVKLESAIEKDKANSEDVALIAGILKQVSLASAKSVDLGDRELSVPDNLIDVDIVPGHMDIGRSDIELSDIIKEDED